MIHFQPLIPTPSANSLSTQRCPFPAAAIKCPRTLSEQRQGRNLGLSIDGNFVGGPNAGPQLYVKEENPNQDWR